MSKSNHEKIVSLFQKEELPYQIEIFKQLQSVVLEGIDQHNKNLQDEQEKFLKIKDQIQK